VSTSTDPPASERKKPRYGVGCGCLLLLWLPAAAMIALADAAVADSPDIWLAGILFLLAFVPGIIVLVRARRARPPQPPPTQTGP
jgi:membrane protein implicated in regulation of membrane protease activity